MRGRRKRRGRRVEGRERQGQETERRKANGLDIEVLKIGIKDGL